MPSIQTIFRVVVMIAVAAVVIKAWKLYGPTNEQVKSTLTQVVETAETAIRGQQSAPADAPSDPRLSAPPIAATSPAAPPAVPAEPPRLLPQTAPSTAATIDPKTMPTVNPLSSMQEVNDPVPQLLSRLQMLGAADTKLAPWGSDGKLYRFTCRAPLASAPTMTQHFESVAAEPAAAVQEVLAKVEAWQVAQRDNGIRRF